MRKTFYIALLSVMVLSINIATTEETSIFDKGDISLPEYTPYTLSLAGNLLIYFALGYIDSGSGDYYTYCDECDGWNFDDCSLTCWSVSDTDTVDDTLWYGFLFKIWALDSSDSWASSDTYYCNTTGFKSFFKCMKCTTGVGGGADSIIVNMWYIPLMNINFGDALLKPLVKGDSIFTQIALTETPDTTWGFDRMITWPDTSEEIYYYSKRIESVSSSSYDWRVILIDKEDPGRDSDVPTEIIETPRDKTRTPNTPALSQNNPNPFNTSTEIIFDLPNAGNVELEITDVVGHRVRILINDTRKVGTHSVIWDGTDDYGIEVPSGIYYYKLIVDNKYYDKRKMTLIR